jgi:Protein of unknown function (DUF2380)
MRRGTLLAVVLLELLAPWRAGAAPARIAVFDFELWDSSLEGELQGAAPADQARLALIGQQLRDALAASGRYEVVDTAPAAAEIARAGYWRSCNGCEVAIAERLGADLALVGWVQKVSNLILNINVTIREVPGGELVFAGGVDIRGNTDESWQHGIRYLLKNRLLKD